jgi:molybdenum cofactor cytidylyltransferase
VVVVVLGAPAQAGRAAIATQQDPRVRIVVNEDFARGISTSLRCGLHACDARAEAAAILLGDQPEVDAPLIDRVLGAFAKTHAPLVRPMFRAAKAHVPGHPVVLARSVWPEVDMLHGDEGARVLFTRSQERVHEVLIPIPPPADIDTVEDYRLAREHGIVAPVVPPRRPE